MDNDSQTAEPTVPAMPRAQTFEPPSSATSGQAVATYAGPVGEDRDRSGVFQRLVTEDGDIAGLVAYSIYKQHKLDWLRAFETAVGRPPDEAELTSYIIGEGTPRRLATYRHLAEATLNGNAPDVDGSRARLAPRRTTAASRSAFTPGLLAIYGLIAVLFVLGFLLAMRFTMTSR